MKEQREGSPEIDIRELDLPAPGFAAFTYPRFHGILLGTAPVTGPGQIVIGALVGETPIGLALFSSPFRENERRLLSVMVNAPWRRRGIGKRLLDVGEAVARSMGTTRLLAVHSSRSSARAAYEGLMRNAGWGEPAAFEHRLAGKAGWALQARQDWAPFLARLRERGFGLTDWSEITAADREAVAALLKEQPAEAAAFDPFVSEQKLAIEPRLSVLLRRHGEIVGWILGSKGALADSVHYTHGYVRPELQRAGWLVGGVLAVSERQAGHLGPESLSTLETSSANRGMRLFMERLERQLKPYWRWSDTRFVIAKSLASCETAAGGSS